MAKMVNFIICICYHNFLKRQERSRGERKRGGPLQMWVKIDLGSVPFQHFEFAGSEESFYDALDWSVVVHQHFHPSVLLGHTSVIIHITFFFLDLYLVMVLEEPLFETLLVALYLRGSVSLLSSQLTLVCRLSINEHLMFDLSAKPHPEL